MDKVLALISKQPVKAISTNDILTFIAIYPEWLSQVGTSWNKVVEVRNHILHGEELDKSVEKEIIEFFLCDLIQISVSRIHVFDEFIITENAEPILTAYRGEPIDIRHYDGMKYSFYQLIKDKELSGVAFLLNMLREVIS